MNEKLLNSLKKMQTSGEFGFPTLKKPKNMPLNLIGFNQLLRADEKLLEISHVHFFIDDYQFERLWNAPARYIEKLKKCRGVIGADFSCYIDAPLALNIWNIFRNRVLDAFLSSLGIDVIPCLVWGAPYTWTFAFEGVPKNSIVAVGSLGCLKGRSLAYFNAGFDEMVKRLNPDRVIVYGELSNELMKKYPGIICNYTNFCKEKWRKNNGKCKMAEK